MTDGSDDKLIGQVIDNYEIQYMIGRGGMGIVYRGYHPDLQKYVAVKVLRPELALQKGFYERFLQEARTIARLEHPNIVDVVNFGRFQDSFYLMMDHVEGPSLRLLIQENEQGLPPWDSVQIAWQIADVLVHSHASGVFHRDLKPDNILLTRSVRPNRPYRVIVTDFGLVKLGEGSLLQTQEGISLGTPAYMSPEQLQGVELDGRTDIYALGVILYETVTGQRPYPIRNVFDAARHHASGELVAPRARNPAVPVELDSLIRHMLVPEAGRRLARAEDAIDELQELLFALSGEPEGTPDSEIRERVNASGQQPVTAPLPYEAITTPTVNPSQEEAGEQYFVRVAYRDIWEEKAYPLGQEPVIVGRLPTSEISLARPGMRFISKRHCEIALKEGRVFVRDLGSTNGTILAGEALEPNVSRQWFPPAELRLGPFTLALRSAEELEAVSSPPEGFAAASQSAVPTTQIRNALRLSCPNAVPSRLPLLAEHPVVVGRSLHCDMVLDHPHVSKRHCRIQIVEGKPEIVDLRSTNGTYLGEKRLPPHTPVPWKEFPTITVGSYVVTLEEKAPRSN